MGGEKVDFFISHAGADRAWAEWVAWQLTDAKYTVELDVWDWAAGRNFVTAMSDALERCERVVALFSAAYFGRDRYTVQEWSASVLHAPGIAEGKLVPVRVEDVPATALPAVLRPLVSRDIFGIGEEGARQVLLDAVAGPRRPDRKPLFPSQQPPTAPGESGPRLPAGMPRVWNVPARNPGFTGRDGLLVAIRERLLTEDRAVVQALQGIGGVGKTQLAVEYAHRFAGTYDLVWWVDAEQAGLLGEQFAALASELGCAGPAATTEAVRSAVLRELRKRCQWLLVFDNAEDPGDIRPWLPGGNGHVLITSREHRWAEIAAPLEVSVLARAESIALLRSRVESFGDIEADQLAAELGDLPLAIAQAAGFMSETGIAAAEYLNLLQVRAGELMGEARPASYPRSLAAAVQLTADRLAKYDPPAAELASLCAFFAPEPIPEDLFTAAASSLPGDLAARAADPLAWRQTLARLARQSLARIDHRGVQMHRLTQAILRDRLAPGQADATRARSEAILANGDPSDIADPANWPRWAQLMPHLMAADLAATDSPGLRGFACEASYYLLAHGDAHVLYQFAGSLRQQWRNRLGDDHEHVRDITFALAQALGILGRHDEGRDLIRDTLERERRIMGTDHIETLLVASSLVNDLYLFGERQAARDLAEDILARGFRDRQPKTGKEDQRSHLLLASLLAVNLRAIGDVQAARDLDEKTLDGRRRILGEDHVDTLGAASSLAADLRELGEMQAARDLDQDTLNRRRRIQGEDHPDTLRTAHYLACDLRELGEMQAARDLDQDTLNRRRWILGEDHPDTLNSAKNLGADLRALGISSSEPDDGGR